MNSKLRALLRLHLVALMMFPFITRSLAQPVGEKVGPQFAFLTGNARTIALADAGSALIDVFPGFGSNPGVLGFLKKSTVDYTSQRVQKGVTYEHIGVTYKVTKSDAIAFGLDILHYGGVDFYTKGDIRDLGFELRTGLAYGRQLGSSFSLGINLQALTSTTGPTSVWAFAGDLGFAYAPAKYVRYGFYLSGFGSDFKTTTSILPTDVFTPRITRLMGLSIVMDFPFSNKSKRIVLALQNEKVLWERDLIYKIGVEYSPYMSSTFSCAIRGGFLSRSSNLSPRFGLGVGYSSFSLDYAYKYTRQNSQPAHTFTLAYAW